MKHDNKSEWHWLTGGIIVSVLSMATYVAFQALSYKSYPFGITASFGNIAAWFQYPFSALAENPVIQKYANSPSSVISITMLFSVALGGFAAAKLNKTFRLGKISGRTYFWRRNGLARLLPGNHALKNWRRQKRCVGWLAGNRSWNLIFCRKCKVF